MFELNFKGGPKPHHNRLCLLENRVGVCACVCITGCRQGGPIKRAGWNYEANPLMRLSHKMINSFLMNDGCPEFCGLCLQLLVDIMTHCSPNDQ